MAALEQLSRQITTEHKRQGVWLSSPILRRDMPDSIKFTLQTMLTKETFSGIMFTASSYRNVQRVARAYGTKVPVTFATLPVDGPTGGLFGADGVIAW
jgi:hypothetical protein